MRWTPEMVETLRAEYARCGPAALAARLGVSRQGAAKKARALGLRTDPRWTAQQKALLRSLYGTMPGGEVAARLGKPLGKVHRMAQSMGLRRGWRPALDGRHDGRIRELNAEGYSDAEIARELEDADRKAVGRRRRLLGLPDNTLSERRRKAVGEKTRAYCASLGCANMAEVKNLAVAAYAEESGWPAGLRLRSVMILNLLAARGVPMSRREIADGIGMPWKGSRASLSSNDPEGSYLAHLAARGLVLRLPKARQVTGEGKGRSLDLYTLGPAALAILHERARTTTKGDQPCE